MKQTAHFVKAIWPYPLRRICLSLVLFFLLCTGSVKAQTFDVFKEPCLFVSLAGGGVDAYPLTAVDGKHGIEADGAYIKLRSGNVVRYPAGEYTNIGTEMPQLPHLTSFKFNNKYNPNLNKDVEAAVIDEVIDLEISAIGKSLTASFQLSDGEAVAYIGNKMQTSKKSRNRFDKSIQYIVTYPGYNVIQEGKKSPFGRIYTINVKWRTDDGKVPRIDIEIEKGYNVTSRSHYLDARFSITGNGVYDDFNAQVQIKGRGNNSWNYKKKSYRLKFPYKVKPFGLTKGKSWVLLANPQKGSMMTNAVAIKIGQLAGAAYTNHVIPVELYINGDYRGSYIFTENIGFSNNSVDVSEEIGCMLELDSYYDEEIRFRSSCSNLPVNIKEPNLWEGAEGNVSTSLLQAMLNGNCQNSIPSQNFPNSSLTAATIAAYKAQIGKFMVIQEQFNRLDSIVCNNGDLSEVLDLDAAARYFLVYDLTYNTEIIHPKSVFLWKGDIASEESKFVLGPIWDFDYAFGYGSSNSYFTNAGKSYFVADNRFPGGRFFTALKENREFQRYYYKVWCEFVENGCIDEVMEYMSDYYSFVESSYTNNAAKWDDGAGYGNHITQMQQWIKERHDYIVANLTVYDIQELVDGPGKAVSDNDNNSHSTYGTYTIYGECVADPENLQPGIYIINGRKVLIKDK